MQPGGGGRPAGVQVSHGQPVQLVGPLLAHAYLTTSLLCPCLHISFVSSSYHGEESGVDLPVIHQTSWLEQRRRG